MAELDEFLRPVVVDEADSTGWSETPPLLFRFALAWAKYGPRGRGRVPRILGKRLGRSLRFTIPTANGARLAVDPENWETYTAIVQNGGVWDPHVTRTCRSRLRPGEVFYDVGSNAGLMTVEVGSAFRDAVRIVAFEPQRSLAMATARSAALNGLRNVSVHRLMLGSEEGTGRLFLTSHSIHASSVSREPAATVLEIPQVTLDAFVERSGGPPPDVLKIDVEGGEWDVLRGARTILREHGPDLVFESDANAERFGYSRRDLCAWLREAGSYEFLLITRDGVVPATGDAREDEVPDLLAVSPRRNRS